MNILNKLTIKHLAMNKKRTIVTIIGIILSTALMVGVGLILSSVREMMIEEVKINNGTHHVIIKNVDYSNLGVLENNLYIKDLTTTSYLGYSKINNETNEYFKIYASGQKYLDTLDLISGRLPRNENEIVLPIHLINRYNLDVKVGETIEFDLGDRYLDGVEIKDIFMHYENEYINIKETKKYIIVGIINKDKYEVSEVGYYAHTKSDNKGLIDAIIEYENPKKAYAITKSLSKSLKIDDKEITYNNALLSLYGQSKYTNLISGLLGVMIIVLSLVSIACMIVIYNSFAISVMERKKQFGLFSSIGATKKQLKKTVLFEAFIVSVIGIPLGIMSAYIGIGTVIFILNKLLKDAVFNGMSFHLVTYIEFILIPIFFMMLTILISALIPAKMASKISPIEAIRLNDDIKVKRKKIKAPKFITNIFGIEGEIAYKSIKRNKKKYRITVASLFISTLLYISFSAYINYTLEAAVDLASMPDFDIMVEYDESVNENVIERIISNEDVKSYTKYMLLRYQYRSIVKGGVYTDKYLDFAKENGYIDKKLETDNNLIILVMEDREFDSYLSEINQSDKLPILYNNYKYTVYSEDSRKTFILEKYKKQPTMEIYKNEGENKEIIGKIDKFHITKKPFLSSKTLEETYSDVIILNREMYNEMFNVETSKFLILKAPIYKNISKILKDEKLTFFNVNEELTMIKNIILAVKLLVYGFIALVTLIGITSVFNTINTCLQLRRKEFAVLRSVGLSPRGFNKILFFESLFFGLKSLIYALPFSGLVIYLLYNSAKGFYETEIIGLPWFSIITAIIGVFLIITISTLYSTKKIKKENILDAIREENI